MMTASQFKKRSNIFMHRRHSPIIKDIDKLMKEYEKSTSDNRKMKCLVYIYMMCKQYLHTKPNGRRGDAIQELMDEIRGILDSADFKRKAAAKAGGVHYSGGRKSDVGTTAGATSTSMASGYTMEGLLPQKNFVQKMGLHMEEILGKNDKYFGMSLVSQDVEAGLQLKGMGMDESAKEAHRLLSTMPFSRVLDQLHSMWATNQSGDFNYLNLEQRLEFLVSVKNGRLWKGTSTVAFDTGKSSFGGGSLAALYAMDTDERMFSPGDVKGVGANWNHSSMLSGHPVICAGEIEVAGGRLLMINNNSGHYKPDTQNLVDCVRSLEYAGLDPTTFTVDDKKTGRTYVSGTQFLASNRGGGVLRT